MYLPEEIINYVIGYLTRCECCQKYNDCSSSRTCVMCKRSWCHECSSKHNYISYCYFEIYVMTCKHCLAELRRPKIQ